MSAGTEGMIGIRREDKSEWEGRVPLVPDHLKRLIDEEGLNFCVQTSPIRAFSDEQYRAAGATLATDLRDCPIILGIKEIPVDRFEPRKTYVFFSHTIKGQSHNMPMLRRLLDLGNQLIDYEKIVDGGKRVVFFGRYAGLAGMIDSLWALGRRLEWEGIPNPFRSIDQAHRYESLNEAMEAVRKAGEAITAGRPPWS